MCHICEREDRFVEAVDATLEKLIETEEANGVKITPFFCAQALTQVAVSNLVAVAQIRDEEEPGFAEKAEEQSNLVAGQVMELLGKLGSTHPGGLMQGNIIIGLIGAAHHMLADANKKSELDTIMKASNPMAALMSLIGLDADESKVQALFDRQPPTAEATSTEEVNNVKDNADFSGLLGVIGDNKE